MFPTWEELVERLLTIDLGEEDAGRLSQGLLARYSPDALIEAIRDRLGHSSDEFAEVIASELYREVKSKLNAGQWNLFTSVVSAHSGQFRASKWRAFLSVLDQRLPQVTARPLAEIIAELVETEFAPDAILSFNAEPLFASLINASWRVSQRSTAQVHKVLDLVTHSISDRKSFRIPYYFCHGLLPVPSPIAGRRIVEAVDKLVFSESSYLQLANTSFSWQSSAFLDISSTKSMVFIGVSLADPNMRRWLSWIHSNRMNELQDIKGIESASTRHFWLSVHPGSAQERRLIESLVAHLGVRLVWMDSWDHTAPALRAMLGM